MLSVATLLSAYRVKSCSFLKIDAKGHDLLILGNYLDQVALKQTRPPRKIQFESNILVPKHKVDQMILRLLTFGYRVV
jgi:hypothetical protein